MSSGMLTDKPLISEPTAKSARPTRNTGLRPNEAATRPQTVVETAVVTR